MAGHVQLSVFFLFLLIAPPSRGLLLSNENEPSLIDQVLQLVWEPSSLIRVWVGLDQLYNIALSWKGVAKTLTSLPFREGRYESHVMIQQPRSLKYHKPSVASQWDRFNEIYASSSLSPIVADARNSPALIRGGNLLPLGKYRNVFFHEDFLRSPATILAQQHLFFGHHAHHHRKASSNLQPLESRTPDAYAAFSQQQGVFLSPDTMSSSNILNELEHFPPFKNAEYPLVSSKLLYLQNQNSLQHSGGVAEQASAALDSNHQQKLTAHLKTLGSIPSKDVSRARLETNSNLLDIETKLTTSFDSTPRRASF